MPGKVRNHLLLEKHKEIISDRYVERKNETIIGSFLALPAVKPSKRKVQVEKDKVASKSKKRKKTKEQDKDIRAFFLNQQR